VRFTDAEGELARAVIQIMRLGYARGLDIGAAIEAELGLHIATQYRRKSRP
jgi:hypothetical protein